ncbi:PucR family transcriptional regulator, partial [Streptomyces sp. NPDC056728]
MADQGIPDASLDGYVRILAAAAATGRRPTRDELDSRRAVGERAAETGHGLRALVGAHLDVTRSHWPATAVSPDSVLAAVAQAVDAFAEGYERAQRLAVRQEEAARREFIDDLLYGRSDLGLLAQRAEHFGLRLSFEHAVAVAQGTVAYDEGDAVLRE